jgi:hypothetical protein
MGEDGLNLESVVKTAGEQAARRTDARTTVEGMTQQAVLGHEPRTRGEQELAEVTARIAKEAQSATIPGFAPRVENLSSQSQRDLTMQLDEARRVIAAEKKRKDQRGALASSTPRTENEFQRSARQTMLSPANESPRPAAPPPVEAAKQ